ncbi:unnamed protein product [Arabis nemorensis]|uniref:Cystatin domain-containing protein n=1 Tax=Arabis nemorensis TaxID=586526 RepID=A0A565AWA5_9BRAS|nr:unnamed protein product [Arabis nemorensis]
MFRYLFNYHLVDPKDYDFLDELNNGELMDKLSRESIRRYNKDKGTEFEFVKVEKVNFHGCCGYMFLITFQVLDPSDKQEKTFQARVRYTTHYPTEYVFFGCDETSKEDDKGDCDETSKERVKGS